MISEKKDDLVASVLLSQAVAKIQGAAKASKKTAKELYDEIRQDQDQLTEERFVAFVTGLSKDGDEAPPFSEEQLKSCFVCLGEGRYDANGRVDVSEKQFLDQLKPRYLCVAASPMTAEMKPVEGSEALRTLEPGDVVEALEEPVLNEDSDAFLVRAECEADGTEGFVMVSSKGRTFLEPYTRYGALQRQVMSSFKEASDAVSRTLTYLKAKSEEIKDSGRTGPLADVRAEFTKLRTKASKAQSAHSQLEKSIRDSRKQLDDLVEEERRRTQEAADKAAAAVMTKAANERVDGVVEEVQKASSEAEAALKKTSGKGESPLKAMDAALDNLEVAVKSVKDALGLIKAKLDDIPQDSKGPYVEVRRLLFKLRVKLSPCEAKCSKQRHALISAREEVTAEANRAVVDFLRGHLRTTELSPHALFDKVAKGEEFLSPDVLRNLFSEISKEALTDVQQELGLHKYGSNGISKLELLMVAYEFHECLKEIAVTTAMDVKKSQTARKLEVGEIVEVVGEGGSDKGPGLQRVKCRALSDGTEGYVTLRGNQGTAFMQSAVKPFYLCEAKGTLFRACDRQSDEVCELPPCEVLELIEGPRQEPATEVKRVRCKRLSDGAIGWVTMSDLKEDVAAGGKVLVCAGATALTNACDIAACKAVRKLEVGEVFVQLEEPTEEASKGLVRVHIRAAKDGIDGWATMKGNQGTEFLSESSSHRISRCRAPLQEGFSSGSKHVLTLDDDDIVEVLEGPKSEKREGSLLAKGRCLSSGAEGWFDTVNAGIVRWSPVYTCVQGTDLREGVEDGASVVRALEEHEVLLALKAPIRADEGGVFYIHVRAEKDGAMGFAATGETGSRGNLFLKPALKLGFA